jgi:hypothetical protein
MMTFKGTLSDHAKPNITRKGIPAKIIFLTFVLIGKF